MTTFKEAVGFHTRGDTTIEVLDVSLWALGVVLFVRAWTRGLPIGFGTTHWSNEVERIRIVNPPELEWCAGGEYRHRTGRVNHNPVRALVDDAFRAIRFGRVSRHIVIGSVGNTTTTARPNAGTGTAPVDGNVRRSGVDETLSTIASGAGTSHDDTSVTANILLRASTTTDQYDILDRFIVGFDTSPVGTDVIQSATVDIFEFSNATNLGSPNYVLTDATPASESDIANGDYANVSGTDLSDRLTHSAIATASEANFTLNASGLANINTSGNTFMACRTSWDVDTSGVTWSSGQFSRIEAYQADQTGTASDPVITIEHTPGAGAGINRGLINNGLINGGLSRM